jgi:NPCBM/NEW2 domain/Chitobiase/beta-hexosaminidase C-terminal domain
MSHAAFVLTACTCHEKIILSLRSGGYPIINIYAKLSLITLVLFIMTKTIDAAPYTVQTKNLSLSLSADGRIVAAAMFAEKQSVELEGFTTLDSCQTVGETTAKRLPNGGVEFLRRLADSSGQNKCRLLERFSPTANSIRWEIEIRGEGKPWSCPIETHINWPEPDNSRFWTAWADPECKKGWNDPLESQPFKDMSLWYGQHSFEAETRPHFHYPDDIFCLPLATVLNKHADTGLSVFLSPEDTMLDMQLITSSTGAIMFSRQHHRITPKRPVRFALDIAAHEGDWRSALAWMVERYPDYFNPPLPAAHQIVGTGAYSQYEGELDVTKCRKMAFRVNWKASFDFPYMGMFIPPVGDEETWRAFNWQTTSISNMRDYSRRMRAMGFHVLNYFNVTEFGNHLSFPPPPSSNLPEKELWKVADDYLHQKLADGILYASDERTHFYSWVRCVAMDPSDPAYQDFLLNQAKRHVEELPDSSGICIDRTDWLRFYNPRRDDGVSWMFDREVASLFVSWQEIMARLAPIMHDAGKVVYINSAASRLDVMRNVDGMFDEFTFRGSHLNKCALLCVNKPLIGWVEAQQEEFTSQPDAFMQQNLYMGCFPMAPFPGNDHSNLPNKSVEQLYMDYGPLLDAMRGKQWVLTPHAVAVEKQEAKANLFAVPGGYVAPVIAGQAESVRVGIRGLGSLAGNGQFVCDALHPDEPETIAVNAFIEGDFMLLDVPLKRGCAMVRIRQTWADADSDYFFTNLKVKLNTAIENAEIRYTLDGTAPTADSPRYTKPILLTDTTPLSARAFMNGKGYLTTFTQFDKVPLPAPVIKASAPLFQDTATVSMSAPVRDCHMVYTLDGSDPSPESTVYRDPMEISSTTTIKARSIMPGAKSSSVASLLVAKIPPVPPLPDVHISDLTPATATVGWGQSPKKDLSIQKRPLKLAGKQYKKGMGVHATSELTYALLPQYKRFVAVVGVDDEVTQYPQASVKFQVWFDGVLAYESPLMKSGLTWHIDLAVPPGSSNISLITTDGGDSAYADHADWVDAGFLTR